MRISDWSSDVCSSDLRIAETPASISGASLPRTTRAVCSSEYRSIGGLDIITQVSAVACALNRVYRAKHDTGIRQPPDSGRDWRRKTHRRGVLAGARGGRLAYSPSLHPVRQGGRTT